jgi:hypothetical protein
MLQAMLAYMAASKMMKKAGIKTSQRLSKRRQAEFFAVGRRLPPLGGWAPFTARRPVGARMVSRFTSAGREGLLALVGR